nr:glycosyltransferase [Desulfonatronovibrio hydrogenovorans]
MHVHSKYSRKPSQWILQKMGCSESYTEPLFIYKRLKDKGMCLVTITDHNCISGCLELAHLEDTFISQEITTYFPEDRCKVHVLAYNITEQQHQDIQMVRQNIFELVDYLNHQQIIHAAAHPLFPVNGKLSFEHFEQLLLLFKIFEYNGAREESLNNALRFMLDQLCPRDFEYLEDKYGYKARSERPWEKGTIGGSDDHSSLNIGRMFTEVPGACDLVDFLKKIENKDAQAKGLASTPKTMAHNLYSIGYQFCKKRFNLEKHVWRDSFLQFMDKALHPGQVPPKSILNSIYRFISQRKMSSQSASGKLHQLLSAETQKLIRTDPEIKTMVNASINPYEHMGAKWFRFANQASNKVLAHWAEQLLSQAASSGFMGVFQTLGSAGSLYTMLSPYFFSYSMFNQDRKMSREFILRFAERKGLNLPDQEMKVAHFTDTFYEVNGVALTLQQQVSTAAKLDRALTILTCHPGDIRPSKDQSVKNFKPIGVFELPEYPELKLFYPPLLEMVEYCFEERITHIHTATPGPIGMTALAVSRLLQIPISGTYHTSLPQYTGYLTNDHALESIMWKYMIWYYNQLDTVFAPSQSTADELKHKGVRTEKIKVYPRGVDTERFNPAKRNGFFEKNYQINGRVKLLYVGRVSKEKNMHILEHAFKDLCSQTTNVHLVIVGDGPYRLEMEQNLKGLPVTFTGYLKGESLTQAFASSDLFVFPSTTDTFGNVVLEAQASGIPAIVVNQGGPMENIIHQKTGLIIPANDIQALKESIFGLVSNPERLRTMGQEARLYMEGRSFEKAFDQAWKMYGQSA